jgi:hypothetical protein
MRWEDERYVRWYTRNTPEWRALSWRARGVFGLLLREVDRAGVLKVGKLGLKGVAVAIEAPMVEVEEAIRELLDDGCIRFDEERQCVWIPNFIEAQECVQSDAARKRASRERARSALGTPSADVAERAMAVTKRDGMESRNVTDGHEQSQAVTSRPPESQEVTLNRTVPSRTDQDPPLPPAEAPDEPAGSLPLPRSEAKMWGEEWIQKYEHAVGAVLKREWCFERKSLPTLEQLIGKFCTDKSRIGDWIAKACSEFVKAVRTDDPKMWSGYQPKGLLRWFNEGRPGYRAPRPQAAERPAPAAQPPLEKPTMTPEQTAAAAARVLEMLKGVGRPIDVVAAPAPPAVPLANGDANGGR